MRLQIYLCAFKIYQQAFWRRCRRNDCWVNFEPSLTLYIISFTFFYSFFFYHEFHSYPPRCCTYECALKSNRIFKAHPNGYELHPCFIKLIRDKSFSGEGDENPYSHLWEFAQTCACLHIDGMSDETLRWKLFPFSLMGRAKQWYSLTVGSMQGDWKMLCSKVVSLQKRF